MKTSIEWTDESVNPFRAMKVSTAIEMEAGAKPVLRGHHCEKVGPDCENCYASTLQARFNLPEYKINERRDVVHYVNEGPINAVLSRRKPTTFFWCSMTDMFGAWVPDRDIAKCFDAMRRTPHHTHIILTKRHLRSVEWFRNREHGKYRHLPNVWMGFSVGNQSTADERLPSLSSLPVGKRIISYEPAIGGVDFTPWLECTCIVRDDGRPLPPSAPRCANCSAGRPDLIIVGGESGHDARPCDVSWIQRTVRQCIWANVAVFVKQLGARPLYTRKWSGTRDTALLTSPWPDGTLFAPYNDLIDRVHLKSAKGKDMAEWPNSLKVRLLPEQEKINGR